MLHGWVTEHQRSLTTVLMLSLRNNHPYRLMSRPFRLTSCFTLSSGHHTVRHKVCLVESKPAGSVGQFNHFMPFFFALPFQWAAELFGLLDALCIKLHHLVYLVSHIFTMGICGHVAADGNCLPPGMVSVNRSLGALCSQPDLTPFILNKHDTKEKLKFYVKGWVITCRKTGLSNFTGSPTTHKSSSNESFLSKQGFKTNGTRSPSAPSLAHCSFSPPFYWSEFL